MTCWNDLLDRPDGRTHFAQFYSDDYALAENVCRYLREGLAQGDAALAIVSAQHQQLFLRTLKYHGVDVNAHEHNGRLLFLDAGQLLSQFMIEGRAEWRPFQTLIARALEPLRPAGRQLIRVYGEMVSLLWEAGQFESAERIEKFWNVILEEHGAALFCAYRIDVFGPQFRSEGVNSILCDHSHLLPSGEGKRLEIALLNATAAVLGQDRHPADLELPLSSPEKWGIIPTAERLILWIRRHLPDSADEILRRAHDEYALDFDPKIVRQ